MFTFRNNWLKFHVFHGFWGNFWKLKSQKKIYIFKSSCEIKDFYVAIVVLLCLSLLSQSQHQQHRLTQIKKGDLTISFKMVRLAASP